MSKAGRTKTKKPNGLLYLAFYLLIFPFLKIVFRLKVDRSNYHPPKGPFIVLSNHLSFMDFALAMLTVYPYRVNAVAAQKFFFYRPLNWLMPRMGAIPKNLFDPDLRSIMAMMEVIKRGDRLLLYPEGRCTVHGPYMGMHKATGKLIKKLQVPVISCYIEGSYVCMPFWRKGFRSGRVRVTLAELFSELETQELSADEINNRIDARLSGIEGRGFRCQNPALPTQKPLATFRARRLVEGLENILYYCPRCQQEFALKTAGNTIQCLACGNTATMDRNAQLQPGEGSVVPKTVAEWYKAQVVHEMQALGEDREAISIEVKVRMPLSRARGLEQCGQGNLRLDSKGWHFDGELKGEDVRKFFPIETVPALPFDPNDNFQIYAGDFYTLTPQVDPCTCVKYATIGECAHWRFATNVQMTPGYDSGFAAVERG